MCTAVPHLRPPPDISRSDGNWKLCYRHSCRLRVHPSNRADASFYNRPRGSRCMAQIPEGLSVIGLSLLAALAANSLLAPPTTCLSHLARTRRAVISNYDRTHDIRGSSSLSCNFGLTPSEVRSDLDSITAAASIANCEALVRNSNIPLAVSRSGAAPRTLRSQAVCQNQIAIKRFIKERTRLFRLEELDLLGWRGAFVGTDEILVNTVKSKHGRAHLRLIAVGPI